jgi:hypothetical protein
MEPDVKALAVALLESGEMRVGEVAELLGQSRQLVWCPGALEADASGASGGGMTLRGAGKVVVDRVKPGAKVTRRAALSKQMEPI